MNFFKSIFSDEIPDDNPQIPNSSPNPNPNPNPNSPPPSPWNLTSLIKSVADKSDTVIQSYKRDVAEFGSGLLKETAIIRDVATRAVTNLPDSIDAGAAVAQESLESVGLVIDNLGSSVIKNTAKIIAKGKELKLFDDDGDREGEEIDDRNSRLGLGTKMSRFEMRLREMEGDVRTYVDEVEGEEEYVEWEKGFVMEEKREEIENLMAAGDGIVGRMYVELVPGEVEREVFWRRYFYRVFKLREAEETRERIVKRAISGEDEEELSWDVDDEDDDDDGDVEGGGVDGSGGVENKSHLVEEEKLVKNDGGEVSLEGGGLEKDIDDDRVVVDDVSRRMENVGNVDEVKEVAEVSEVSGDVQEVKVDESGVIEGKAVTDSGESCKDSDISIVSTQPSLAGEEELGWDEIEDVGSDDEGSKTAASKSSNVVDLRKRLSAADEEDDLSWDIEDDDEPAK